MAALVFFSLGSELQRSPHLKNFEKIACNSKKIANFAHIYKQLFTITESNSPLNL